MIRKTIIIFFVFFTSWVTIFSQHLSHQVLVPAAGIAVSSAVSYTQTIGETATETISCSGYVFTQGFQQPGIEPSQETPPDGNGVEVYPNPATDYINIKLFGDGARKFRIELININGMVVSSTAINFITNYFYTQRIEVEYLTSGLYFVRVVSKDGLINRSFKIEKM
jgi:type IX secretion system substrate protein